MVYTMGVPSFFGFELARSCRVRICFSAKCNNKCGNLPVRHRGTRVTISWSWVTHPIMPMKQTVCRSGSLMAQNLVWSLRKNRFHSIVDSLV